jgi:DNA processing protein
MKSDLNEEKLYLFLLSKIKGFGQAKIWQLIQAGQAPSEIYASPPEKLARLIKSESRFYQARVKEYEQLTDHLTILDSDYPRLLKNIYDPPLWLFYKGNKKLLTSDFLITIVGSRTLTSYHQAVTKKIIQAFQNTPLVIVSGLALGIDGLSHQAALENNLPTVAVLGSGFAKNTLYPQQNLALAQKIVSHDGLLLSEYPPDTPPALHQFPKRNRILAGLSKATMIISGRAKSGTLITAQLALDGGREVYALPGNVNLELNQGPNQLIEQGADILLNNEKIFATYDLKQTPKQASLNLDDPYQRQVYSSLHIEALTLEQLSTRLKVDLSIINVAVTKLELKGLAQINKFNQAEII